MNEIGLYIHIPFCMKKCRYCDFTSFAGAGEFFDPYTRALVNEIEKKASWVKGYEVNSIFVGGGTPVILKRRQIADIFSAVFKNYNVSDDCEITVEANPGVLTKEMLKEFRSIGVNRLSIGVQAWQKHLLELMGRIHTNVDARKAVDMAQMADIDNISADLIFGIPYQKVSDWEESLLKTIDMGVKHISAYSLIFEEGTPFTEALERGELKAISDKDDRRMYYLADEILGDFGFKKYEISNYGKEGFFSRHNIKYWECKEYLGFGVSAHSYFDGRRFSNTEILSNYIKNEGIPSLVETFSERLSKKIKMSEFMFMGLRMTEGISLDEFRKRFMENPEDVFGEKIEEFIDKKLLEKTEKGFKLTRRGIDVSNVVFEGFIL